MSNPLELPPELEDALAWPPQASRRSFLVGSGALAITLSLSAVPGARALAQAPAAAAGPYPDPDFLKLDTWIVIHPDNTATFYVGKTDGGQGTGTAFRQMMCDELDIAFDKTRLVMGCTDITPDQGGSGGSTSVERDGRPMRRVAAEARRVLLELGGQHLAVATFIGNAISVSLVSWPLMQIAVFCMKWWLQPSPAHRRRAEILGIAAMLGLYLMELIAFRLTF